MEGLGGRPGSPDQTDVEAVTEAVELLQVASTRVRLYGEAHPQTKMAVTAFAARMAEVVEWLGTIRLDTGDAGFKWRGTPVSVETDEKSGLGRHTHIEGISWLSFSPGVTDDEIEELLSVLRINLSLPQYEEETLESLLWQAELKNVGFRAIDELMEAEAISGREDDASQLAAARGLVHMRPGDLQEGRSMAALLGPDDVRGGDIVDHWDLGVELDLEAVSDDEWRERFAEEAGDDYAAILKVRDGIRHERSSSILSRLVLVLLRCVIHGRVEVGQKDGVDMAKAAIRQIYANGDPVGLLEVIETGHAIAESLRQTRPDITDWLREFLRSVYSPLRAARMLRALNPDDPIEGETLTRFLRILPASSLIALFEGIARAEEPEEYQPLLQAIVEQSAAKVGGWLQKSEGLPAEQLVPIVHGLRLSRSPRFEDWRPHLLRSAFPGTREAVLLWYETSGIPKTEEGLVAAALVDRSPIVRAAATRTLRVHRPPDAIRLIRRTLQGESFAQLDQERKTDLCETFGTLAGQGGITVLTSLLNTKTGVLGSDEARSTIQAAALGLASMGTVNALRVLEKGTRGFGGARKAACQFALGVHDQRRHLHDADVD